MNEDSPYGFLEDIRTKLDLVLEGQRVLLKEIEDFGQKIGEKIDCLDIKLEGLIKKVDVWADDLTARRADTEAHPQVYRIRTVVVMEPVKVDGASSHVYRIRES